MAFSRRRFVTTALAALAALGMPLPALAQRFLSSQPARPPAKPKDPRGRRKWYRLSGRGRRISNAAKSHNANMRFATPHAADLHRAHPGDRSRIVSEIISVEEYQRLFVNRGSHVVDLRYVKR